MGASIHPHWQMCYQIPSVQLIGLVHYKARKSALLRHGLDEVYPETQVARQQLLQEGELQPFHSVLLRLPVTDETRIAPALNTVAQELGSQVSIGSYPVRGRAGRSFTHACRLSACHGTHELQACIPDAEAGLLVMLMAIVCCHLYAAGPAQCSTTSSIACMDVHLLELGCTSKANPGVCSVNIRH